MAPPTGPLTPAEIDHFMDHGFVRLSNCFSREKAAEWTRDVWVRLGYSPDDPDTWTTERINMPHHNSEPVAAFAPKAWAAMCQLLGGEARISPDSRMWHDNLIVNLGSKDDSTWTEPSELKGWHVDGDFFTHYLDSAEQALLVIPLFTDIAPRGGATVICPDGIAMIARHLHDHPEGVSPRMVPRAAQHPGQAHTESLAFFQARARASGNFVEATGKVGDVYLLHPFMLHTASRNALRRPRIITNPNIALAAPFCFDRRNPDEYSVVERKTLRALGRESLPGWRAAGPRERVVPEREMLQARIKEVERRRLRGEVVTGEYGDGLGEVNRAAQEVAVA